MCIIICVERTYNYMYICSLQNRPFSKSLVFGHFKVSAPQKSSSAWAEMLFSRNNLSVI